jgi:cellulose biosynthesis protein BcsE
MLDKNDDLAIALPTVNLGVRGLADLSGDMVSGGIYALEAKMTSARFPLFAGCLASALSGLGLATVIVPSKPEAIVERMSQYPELDVPARLEVDDLKVFVMQPEFQKKMFRFGAGSFVRELEELAIPPKSFLIFDQADDLLALHDVGLALEQMDALSKWFREKSITCLLVFSRVAEEQSWALDALMDSMTGIASIGGHGEGLELTSKYWRSPEGTIAATSYRLGNTSDGYYEVVAKEEPKVRIEQVLPVVAPGLMAQIAAPEAAASPITPATQAKEAAVSPAQHKVERVFYMDTELECLSSGDTIPWTRIDSLVGIMHATLSCKDATVILGYGPKTNMRELAATVHSLRLGLGPLAHIVVRESNASLRYPNEALLLHLGVSLVIHRDVTVSRIPLMLQTLHGRTYKVPHDVAFDAALASVAPTEVRGYLATTRFEREVNQILERAEMLDIPNALVVGTPNTNSVVDFLRVVHPARPGDLLTSDGVMCYLFLNACPPSAVGLTMNKLLSTVQGLSLKNQRVLTQAEVIRAELKAMQTVARKAHFPDFSTVLQEETSDEKVVEELVASEKALEPLPVVEQTVSETAQVAATVEAAPELLVATADAGQEDPFTQGVIRPFDRYRYAPTAPVQVAGKAAVPRATRSVAAQ